MQIQTPNKTLSVSEETMPYPNACTYMQGSCRYVSANEIRFTVVCNKQTKEAGRHYTVKAVQQRGTWRTVANQSID